MVAGGYRAAWATLDMAPTLIRQFGCGSCHLVPGIDGAMGVVGPPLVQVGRRIYIAGVLRNTPPNPVRWLRDPQAIVSGNTMPDMHIDEPMRETWPHISIPCDSRGLDDDHRQSIISCSLIPEVGYWRERHRPNFLMSL